METSRFRRLHSLSGVVPLGAFLAFHLFVNSSAARGADAFNATVHNLQQVPLLGLVEIAALFLPLAFHGVGGLFIIAGSPVSAERSDPTSRALARLQRVTGVVLFVFIFFHLWTARLVAFGDHGNLDLFHLMQAALASPWIRAAYVGGILAATSHFSTGLYTFAKAWGLASTQPARIAVAVAAAVVFAILSVLGLRTVAAFPLPNPI